MFENVLLSLPAEEILQILYGHPSGIRAALDQFPRAAEKIDAAGLLVSFPHIPADTGVLAYVEDSVISHRDLAIQVLRIIARGDSAPFRYLKIVAGGARDRYNSENPCAKDPRNLEIRSFLVEIEFARNRKAAHQSAVRFCNKCYGLELSDPLRRAAQKFLISSQS